MIKLIVNKIRSVEYRGAEESHEWIEQVELNMPFNNWPLEINNCFH